MAGTDIGIDLGTSSILVYVRGKGVVLKEPSVVAFDRDNNKIKAIGEEARLMLGRTPGNIVAVRPMKNGIISDYVVTEQMLRHFIQKAMGRRKGSTCGRGTGGCGHRRRNRYFQTKWKYDRRYRRRHLQRGGALHQWSCGEPFH